MHLETFCCTLQAGWPADLPTQLDSEQTLLLVFGAASCIDRPEPLIELTRRFPATRILGCSTVGEIQGARSSMTRWPWR